jgi:hypothetical protein
VHVRVETTAPDDVAAWRRDGDTAEAREQRAREEERRTDLAGEHGIEVGLRSARGIDPYLVRAAPFRLCAHVGE